MQSRKTVQQLITAHLEWRRNLLEFAYTGKHSGWTDSVKSGDSTKCELGKLLSEIDIKSCPILPLILEVHQRFHENAKEIYDLAFAGRTQEVERILNSPTSSFMETTFHLIGLLRQLDEKMIDKKLTLI